MRRGLRRWAAARDGGRTAWRGSAGGQRKANERVRASSPGAFFLLVSVKVHSFFFRDGPSFAIGALNRPKAPPCNSVLQQGSAHQCRKVRSLAKKALACSQKPGE